MNKLEKKILEEGIILDNNFLKIDSISKHPLDVNLIKDISNEFYNYFKFKKIDKIVTIQSSGFASAFATSFRFHKPLVILKEQNSDVISDDFYRVKVHSFTKNIDYTLATLKESLNQGENVLLIVDFLANGEMTLGATKIIKEAKCNLVGIGIVIEKSFLLGREKIEKMGVDIYSLVKISKMDNGVIEFK